MRRHSLSVCKKEGEYVEAFRLGDYANVLKKHMPDRIDNNKGVYTIHNEAGDIQGRYTDYFTHAPNGDIEIISNFDINRRYDELGDNVYVKNPVPQSAWMPGCGKNELVSFLQENGLLELNSSDLSSYYLIKQNGEERSMPVDSVLVFDKVNRENKEIVSIDFDVVSDTEFNDNYDVLGMDTLVAHFDESLSNTDDMKDVFYGNMRKVLTNPYLADFASAQELSERVNEIKEARRQAQEQAQEHAQEQTVESDTVEEVESEEEVKESDDGLEL